MTTVIGLISGTSVDGIDAALADIRGTEWDLKVELLAAATYPYPPELRSRILALCGGAAVSMAELAELDDAIAEQFARAALAIKGDRPVELIGSHGQTVYHRPPSNGKLVETPFTPSSEPHQLAPSSPPPLPGLQPATGSRGCHCPPDGDRDSEQLSRRRYCC